MNKSLNYQNRASKHIKSSFLPEKKTAGLAPGAPMDGWKVGTRQVPGDHLDLEFATRHRTPHRT